MPTVLGLGLGASSPQSSSLLSSSPRDVARARPCFVIQLGASDLLLGAWK